MKKRGLLLVAVLAIAALVWLLYGGDGARGRSTNRDTASTDGVARNPAREALPSSAAETTPAAKRMLRVRIDATGGDITDAAVTIFCGKQSIAARLPVGVDNDVDIGWMLKVPAATASVHADHEDCLPAETTVALAQGREGVVGTAVLKLHVAAIVHGCVQRADGSPWPMASVSLFPIRDGQPVDDPVAGAQTDDAGAFRMRVGAEGAHLLIALEEDRVPASARVELWTGRDTEAVPLVLVPGVSISGRVRVNGEAPGGQAIVRAIPNMEGVSLWVGNVLWAQGRAYHAEALGFTKRDGSYRVGGLAPGPYRIRVSDLPVAHPDLTGSRTERAVLAPAESVDFDLAGAVLDLRIGRVPAGEAEEPPRYGLLVVGTGKVPFGLSTTAPEPVRLAVLPASDYRITLNVTGREPTTRDVHAPAAGEVMEVRLAPGPPQQRATLDATLKAARGALPARAEFAFFRGVARLLTRDVEVVAGRVRLEDLPTGKFRVVVRPSAPYWQEAEAEVELRAGAPTQVALAFERGGALRVTARAAAGALLEANCRVVDARGRDAPVEFVSSNGRASGPELLRRGGPSDVRPALSPGRYTLTFTYAGFAPVTREVEIREGERTEVEVTLQPER